MKKVAIVFILAVVLTLVVAGPVLADGPSVPGYGNDAGIQLPPNEVYVPDNAYNARGGDVPGNSAWNNGAIFYKVEDGEF